MQEQVPGLERPKLDRKSATEPEDQEGKNPPKIIENEVEFQRTDEAESAAVFAQRGGERDCREDQGDERPGRDKEQGPAPLQRAFSPGRTIRYVHGTENKRVKG